MHLQIVIAFALLLWWPDGAPAEALVTRTSTVLAIVWATPLVLAVAGQFLASIARARLAKPGGASAGMSVFHRGLLVLRLAALGALAGHLLLTTWPQILGHALAQVPVIHWIPGLTQLGITVPYLLSLAALWWVLYPLEQFGRESPPARPRTSRWRYVVFNFRHQVLIVALPLGIIVVAYAATRDYRAALVSATGSKWAPEALLGAVAVAIFIFSPVLLRRVWATSRLPDGPLRTKLLNLCDRIHLNVREILVWHSDGMMVNAAVMGLFPRVRYILLSDTLLTAMTDEEIEAVFGHEAGHVRHRHIPYFLLFALISMLVAAGVIELLARTCRGPGAAFPLSDDVIQMLGIASVIPIWGIGFGWVSRRFERQADVFGAACASPPANGTACRIPCTVHDGPPPATAAALCATGAQIFVNALFKVALLNGIPVAERSWRHSSIAARMRFLTALGGDPMMARRFGRCVRGIKLALVLLAAGGLTLAGLYLWQNPGYRREIVTSVLDPIRHWLR
ncbi:MAG TPA: M48 family metallopeptidase [Phycisphaerae bacterium]|nr:M48 family metalloprotease [Phycisphaerales bacterium]HRX86737.1 M48 family metallopeptidase [Phycisphaerae bacterium]